MSVTTGQTPEDKINEISEELISRAREHYVRRINEILIDGVEACRRSADEQAAQHGGLSKKNLNYMRGYVDALSDARVAVTQHL